MVNFADLSRDTGLPVMTLRRYCQLLEATYQVALLPPYSSSTAKRLVKTPKLYVTDTGLGCYLAGTDTWEAVERQGRSGAVLETWVACELRRAMAVAPKRTGVCFWRSHEGREVDFVLEGPDLRLVGIEVKKATRIEAKDRAGLDKLREIAGRRMGLGVILYGGPEVVGIDKMTLAVPLGRVFGPEV